MSVLKEKYNKDLTVMLKRDLKMRNTFQVPKLLSVTVSTGIGKHKEDKGNIESIVKQFANIVGQKPKVNRSKKAVSAYKLRIGQVVGLSATLRGSKMYDFVYKLTSAVLPRVRDFRGIKNSSIDGNGNISIAIREHTIVPEVKQEDVKEPFGFQVNIKTSATNDKDAKALLVALGFVFEKENSK